MDSGGLSTPDIVTVLLPVLDVACRLDGRETCWADAYDPEGGHGTEDCACCGGTGDPDASRWMRGSARARRGSRALRGSMKFSMVVEWATLVRNLLLGRFTTEASVCIRRALGWWAKLKAHSNWLLLKAPVSSGSPDPSSRCH